MDWSKYEKVPTAFATAREIGLAAASLGALERRGFVESTKTSPKQYRRIESPRVIIYKLIDENRGDFDDFFTLRKEGAPYGMLCSLNKAGDILDCWGKIYDLTDVNYIKFKTKEFNL